MPTILEAIPAAPVLVRTGIPGKPLQWVDPTPHTADELGHVWRFDKDELADVHCLLCCNEPDAVRPGARCDEAHLILIINEHRARWIAERRVEGEDI